MKYDVIIVGLGPAGITAAIYAKRGGLNVLCLEKNMPGGMLNYITQIDNYPGEKSITGPDLAFKMFEQIRELKIDYKIKSVDRIILEDGLKKVIISDDEYYYTKNVIIATGREPKHLGLPNEKELLGNGISTCAICDGSLYRDLDVAVIGGGDSALSEAIYLSNICNKVYLIHRRETFRASEALVEAMNRKNNIDCILSTNVTKINSLSGRLHSITLNDKEELPISGLFTYIGYIPGTRFVDTLNILNDVGYIVVDKNFESSVEGIYAVGDIIQKDVYQVVTSCGEGAVAALNVVKKIESE